MVQFYRPMAMTDASRTARALLEDLQGLIMSVKLPAVAGDPNIRLERGQQDITTDPNKVTQFLIQYCFYV